MKYFIDQVLPDCWMGVIMAFRDGKIGKGVYTEALSLHDACCAVWEVDAAGSFNAWAPDQSRCLSVEETRNRVRDADGLPLPY